MFVSRRVATLVIGSVASVAIAVIACNGETADSCASVQMSCDGKCTNVDSDPQNCGSCGKTCDQSSVCSKGSCVSLCAPLATVCTTGSSFTCVDTQTDNKNCGACGAACKNLEACVAGKCQGGCPQGEEPCVPDAGAAFCAHVISDNQNCGACFNKCGPLSVCSIGACSNQCAQGQTTCSPDAGSPYCANTQTDNANCGTCGKTCGTLEVCAGGKCASSCLSSQTLCVDDGGADGGSYCADTKNDNANCGSCGNSCTLQKPLCSNGSCISPG